MIRISLKGIWAHKGRLLRTCSAVLLGVAFLAGTLILGDTMRAGFSQVFADVYAKTDVVVQGTRTIGDQSDSRMIIPEDVFTRIEAVSGVGQAIPGISGAAQVIGRDGQPLGGQGPPTLGNAWTKGDPTNPYTLSKGRAPEAPDEVVLNALTATQGKFGVGDTITIRTPNPIKAKVVGIATFGSRDSIGGEGFVGFTPSDARKYLLGGAAGYSDVSILAAKGTTASELATRVQKVLPEGLGAKTADEMRAQSEEQIGSAFLNGFEMILLIFTGVALLVATFSIYNTFSVILAQRTRESALFRAIGATRSQVLGSIGIEALFVGITASLGGLAAGFVLAKGLMALMRSFGVDLPGSTEVTGNSVVVSIVVGLIVTILASMVPAIRASRVRPIEALRDAAVDQSGTSPVRAVIGVLVSVAGLALVLVGALGSLKSPLGIAGTGAVLLLIGIVVLGPVVARPAAFILGAPVAAARGASGELAVQNAARNPTRTSGTAAALMIGVAVVVLFTVIGSSLKTMVRDTLTGSVRADLMMAEQSVGGGVSGLSPEFASRIAEIDEVKEAVGIGAGYMLLDKHPTQILFADPEKVSTVVDMGVSRGSIAALGDSGIAVSKQSASENHWRVGSKVPVAFIDGFVGQLEVEAIYEHRDVLGNFLLPRKIWSKHSTGDVDALVLVSLKPGADLEKVRGEIDTIGKDYGAPKALTRSEYADKAAGQVNQLLMIIYVLLALSIVIAVMGIANTLSLSLHERTRELGLLRAIGQTRRQLRSMVRWESVIIAVFGTVGGVGLGLFLGWAMIRSLASEGLSGFTAPIGQLVLITAVGAITGVLASLLPARRAARLDVLDAIAAE